MSSARALLQARTQGPGKQTMDSGNTCRRVPVCLYANWQKFFDDIAKKKNSGTWENNITVEAEDLITWEMTLFSNITQLSVRLLYLPAHW